MFTSAQQYLRTVEEGKASCVVIGLGLRGDISGLDLARAILVVEAGNTRDLHRGISTHVDEGRRPCSWGCIAFLEEPVSSELLFPRSGARASRVEAVRHPGPGR
jgi:FixJ family two-component response regulator